MPIQKVILVGPRGFCAGVDRAIKVVEECLELFGKPVYVKHQIVHNKYVVEALERKGAITVEDIDEIPDNAVAIFSAHGSPPEQYEQAKKKNLKLIDATCPLVTKVHFEVHRFAKQGYKVIYIGHHGHVEGIGVMGELPNDIPLVETV
ncbi:MAG: 4-hydroxy-3-methylbut-2-enyl diphosphate reductase, partial [Nanoarchaeota archaeon]|nr:4-hydroxy-3-methylbut-2-enyl diphosphate reductase [Nanoarchaeota archaeon]